MLINNLAIEPECDRGLIDAIVPKEVATASSTPVAHESGDAQNFCEQQVVLTIKATVGAGLHPPRSVLTTYRVPSIGLRCRTTAHYVYRSR